MRFDRSDPDPKMDRGFLGGLTRIQVFLLNRIRIRVTSDPSLLSAWVSLPYPIKGP